MPTDTSDFAPLAEFVQAEMQRLGVPGVAVGLLHGDAEYTQGFGITSVENPLPVQADSLFQIGSISKTFTAQAFMRLVEAGKLALDTPIRHYLPDFRLADETVAQNVTPRHLFNHSSGWLGDYFVDFGNGDDAVGRYVASMADLPQITPLGELFSYNNSGFSVAGRLIEVASGKSFEAAMRELVFAPLGLQQIFYAPQDVMTYRFAVGHNVRDGKAQVARPYALLRARYAAGAIITNVKELLRYARMNLANGLAADGKPFLNQNTINLMRTPSVNTGKDEEHIGVSWFIRKVGGVTTYGHGGATNGQMANFVFVPEHSFALAVLTNADRGSELHTTVTKWALEHFLGAREPELTTLNLAGDKLAEYAGRYVAGVSDAQIEVKGDDLQLQAIPTSGYPTRDTPLPPPPPPTRLAFYAPDKVVALDPPFKDGQGQFLRDKAGKVVYFRWGLRIGVRSPQPL